MSTKAQPEIDVSRDPNDYCPTTHFIQKKKDRKVAGWKIEDAIKNGDVRESSQDNRVIFDSDHIGLIVEGEDVITVINDPKRGSDRYQ